MLLDLRLVTPPAVTPVSLVEAKAHLNVGDTGEDATIQGYLDAAVAWLDGYAGVLGRALVTQGWILSLDRFPGRALAGLVIAGHTHGLQHRYRHPTRIHLPLPPLVAVSQVGYVDTAGANQVLAVDQYVVLDGPMAAIDTAPGVSWPATRPQARAVNISFTAGYGVTGASVPAALRSAILLLVGHWYMNREAVVGVDQRGTPMPTPIGVTELIRGFIVR